MPGVKAILTADDVPDLNGAEKALTNEPLYAGEPILAVAAVDEESAAAAIEAIRSISQPLPFVVDPLDSLRPGGPNARREGNVWAAPQPPAPGRRAPAPPALETVKWTEEDFANDEGGDWPVADGPRARGVVVRRSRGRLHESGSRPG